MPLFSAKKNPFFLHFIVKVTHISAYFIFNLAGQSYKMNPLFSAHIKPWMDLGGGEGGIIAFLGLTKKTEVWTQILITESLDSASYASETFQREHEKLTQKEYGLSAPVIHLGE